MANQFKQKQVEVMTSAIKGLLATGKMSDVELQCTGGIISAHKLILSAVSPFFDALFAKDTLDGSSADRIQFDYSAHAMKIVINFLYTGEIPDILDEDLASVMEILEITHVMEITLLFEHYGTIFNNSLSTSNFLLHLRTTDQYWQLNPSKNIITFMVDNLQDIVKEDSFNQLNCNEVFNVIQLAVERNIKTDVIVSCILNWGHYDQENRSCDVLKFVEYIGLSKLSNLYLQSLFQNDLVQTCDQLKQILINEAIKRLSLTDSISDNNVNKKLHIQLTAITRTKGTVHEKSQNYNYHEKYWTVMKTTTCPQQQYTSLCLIYNTQGEPYYFSRDADNKIVAYNPSCDRSVTGCGFSKNPSMGVVFGKTICFLSNDIIAQYCTDTEQWKTIEKPLSSENNQYALMSVGKELFMYDRAIRTLCRYNVNYDEWRFEAIYSTSLNHVWSKCVSQSCRGKLFFTDDNRQLVIYDTKTKEWNACANPDLINAVPLFASCDYSFVMFIKELKLMFYNCDTDETECVPDGYCTELLFYNSLPDIYLQ